MLTSPLMVMLTRTVYNDAPGQHPSELLDAERFPEVEDLENHLLAAYPDTVYARRDTGPRRARRPDWKPDRARRWLGYLATHLVKLKTHDLTWWQLPTTLHRYTRIITTTAMFGLVGELLAGPGTGLAFGFACGLINEVGFSRGRPGREPQRVRLRLPRDSAMRFSLTHLKRSAFEFVSGLGFGLTLGLIFGLAVWRAREFSAASVPVLMTGLGFGLTLGLVNVVLSTLGADQASQDSTSPWQLLTTDRTITLVRMIVTVFAVPLLLVIVDMRIMFGLGIILMIGMVRLVLSAWGSWLLFVRLWLPLTGRLPWRPKRFLEDAYARGVLRRTGAAYQFRHARLRDHLAAKDRS